MDKKSYEFKLASVSLIASTFLISAVKFAIRFFRKQP